MKKHKERNAQIAFLCICFSKKIVASTPLAQKKSMWMDFNAGVVADGTQTIEENGAELMDFVLSIASGEQTKTEQKGFRELSIFKDGVVL